MTITKPYFWHANCNEPTSTETFQICKKHLLRYFPTMLKGLTNITNHILDCEWFLLVILIRKATQLRAKKLFQNYFVLQSF